MMQGKAVFLASFFCIGHSPAKKTPLLQDAERAKSLIFLE